MSEEIQRAGNLANARKKIKQAVNPISQAKQAFSFGKKAVKHWAILVVAGVFDLLSLIPFIGFIFNVAFGFILFLVFGPKKTKNPNANLLGIVLPIGLGSAIDWIPIISALPVCIGATLTRIYLADE